MNLPKITPRRLFGVISLGLVVGLTTLLVFFALYAHKSGLWNDVLQPAIKKVSLPIVNTFRSDILVPPTLQLQLDPNHLDSIASIRNTALQHGVLAEGKDSWFPVKMVWHKDTVQGKLRLKGGLTDHFATSKWSFKVKLDSGQRIMGCSTFAIQHPNTRNFSYEWGFHQVLSHQGFANIKYAFIGVKLNGKDKGLFAFEENFDHNWAAKHPQVYGPVMKFDDEKRIRAMAKDMAAQYDSENFPESSWHTADIDTFRKKQVKNDSAMSALYRINKEQLEAFRNGIIAIDSVFDLQQTASYFALCDILGAQHAQDWRNIRFVRSFANDKLIPVGYDGNTGERIEHVRAQLEQRPIDFKYRDGDGFYERFFNSIEFYKHYQAYLEKYSDSQFIIQEMSDLEGGLDTCERIIAGEFPRFDLDQQVFELNQIRALNSISGAAHFWFHNATVDSLELSSWFALPVFIQAGVIGEDTVYLNTEISIPGSDLLLDPDSISSTVIANPFNSPPNILGWSKQSVKTRGKLNWEALVPR